jgi:hypothetical protein
VLFSVADELLDGVCIGDAFEVSFVVVSLDLVVVLDGLGDDEVCAFAELIAAANAAAAAQRRSFFMVVDLVSHRAIRVRAQGTYRAPR